MKQRFLRVNPYFVCILHTHKRSHTYEHTSDEIQSQRWWKRLHMSKILLYVFNCVEMWWWHGPQHVIHINFPLIEPFCEPSCSVDGDHCHQGRNSPRTTSYWSAVTFPSNGNKRTLKLNGGTVFNAFPLINSGFYLLIYHQSLVNTDTNNEGFKLFRKSAL